MSLSISDETKITADPSDDTSCDDLSGEESNFAIQILKGLDDSCSIKSESSSGGPSESFNQDVRNTITKSFEECLNSGDPEYFRYILSPAFDEKCVVESYRLKQIGMIGSEDIESVISGKDQVIPYFMGYIASIPDLIFLIHEWKLFNRAGGLSCLMFKFTLSGNQIIPNDSKCKIEEEENSDAGIASSEMNLSGKKRNNPPENSIKFKYSSYQGRQQDKRKKHKTLGEFVTDNRVYDKHVAQVSTLLQDAAQEVLPDEIKPVVVPESVSTTEHKAENMSLESMGLQNALKINMRGVMRFHFNENNQVYKIHCVHFTSH